MESIILRSFEDSDINLMSAWLKKDFVKIWYKNPFSWINEIKLRHSTYSFIKHKIAVLNNIPIGFCQYYNCYTAHEDWYTVSENDRIFSIDYMIGEENYLKCGFGKQIVSSLTGELNETADSIIVKPDEENEASIRTLMSCGFIFDEKLQYYIKDLHKL